MFLIHELLLHRASIWDSFGHIQMTHEITKQLQSLAYRLVFGLRIVTKKVHEIYFIFFIFIFYLFIFHLFLLVGGQLLYNIVVVFAIY